MPRRSGVVILATVTALGAAGCTSGRDRAAADASMSVSPQAALLDRPVTVSVRGLPAGARTTVTATATDAGGTSWSASADFQATSTGTVSLEQLPVRGSYTGSNPMGLFQFMAPPPDVTRISFEQPVSGGYDVTLTATVSGRVVATTSVRRQTPAEAGVTAKDLRPPDDGVHGTVYQPTGTTTAPRPAVLVFGGSEGGLHPAVTLMASLLAAHGYPSLALAYFKEPGLPQSLTAVPLEYFARALALLRAQPGVDPRRVFVMGASRGGEAALLLGAYFPRLVNGVIAQVPGSYVNPAIPVSGRSAWTLRGRDLPHAGAAKFGAPAASVDPRALIPVERIRGPILLSCGEMDVVWPSCGYVDDITGRLTARSFAHPVTALRYPDAGHLAGTIPPYTSVTDGAVARSGGTVAGIQTASVAVQTRVLALLASR